MLDRNKAPPKNRRKTLIGKNILWHGKNQVVFSSAFPTRQCCCIFRNKLARAHCWTGQGCLWRVSHSSAWRCLNVRLTGPWNGWPPISTICLQCTTMMARGRRVKCVSWQWVGRGFTARPSSCSCSGYMAAPPPRPAAQKWPLTALHCLQRPSWPTSNALQQQPASIDIASLAHPSFCFPLPWDLALSLKSQRIILCQ